MEEPIDDDWTYTERELKSIQKHAGKLYQLACMLSWNAADIPGQPAEKIVYRNQLEEIQDLLHTIETDHDV